MLNQIYFNAVRIPVEVEIGMRASVVELFHLFDNDKIFKKTSAKRIVHQLFYGFNSSQSTGESSVVEIDFRGFHEPLASILEPWREKKGYVRCVENGEPFCRGLCGDAAIVGYRCDIQNGTDTPDNNFEEGCEECRIFDIQKLMDVSFHISGGVVFEKFRDFPIVDKISWISSAKNAGQGISTFGYFRRFMNIERKKCKYGASPCKCLCDTLHEKNVIGASENKERVFLFVVHNFLNVRQEIGCALHFVKNGAIRELP